MFALSVVYPLKRIAANMTPDVPRNAMSVCSCTVHCRHLPRQVRMPVTYTGVTDRPSDGCETISKSSQGPISSMMVLGLVLALGVDIIFGLGLVLGTWLSLVSC